MRAIIVGDDHEMQQERSIMVGELRTTVGIKNITKKKLDKNKAPGQCYDGFICQLVELWERTDGGRMISVASSVGANRGVEVGHANSLNDNFPIR